MKNNKNTFLLSVILPTFFVLTFLFNTHAYACATIGVKILNDLPVSCTKTSDSLDDGYWSQEPSDLRSKTETTDRQQIVAVSQGNLDSRPGPHFELSYDCSGWKFHITVGVDDCALWDRGDLDHYEIDIDPSSTGAINKENVHDDDNDVYFDLKAADPGDNLQATNITATQVNDLNEKFTWTVSSSKDLGFNHKDASAASSVIVDGTTTVPASSCTQDEGTNTYHCTATWNHGPENSGQTPEQHTSQIKTVDSIYTLGTDARAQTFNEPDFTTQSVVINDVKFVSDPNPKHSGYYMLEGDYDKPIEFDIRNDDDNYIEIYDDAAPEKVYKFNSTFSSGCLVARECYFDLPLYQKVPVDFFVKSHVYTVKTSFNYTSGGAATLVEKTFSKSIAPSAISIDAQSVKQLQVGNNANFAWTMNWTGDVKGANYSIKITDPSSPDTPVDGIENLICANNNHTCNGSFTTSKPLIADHSYDYTITAKDTGNTGAVASPYTSSFTLGSVKVQNVVHQAIRKDGKNYEEFTWDVNLLSTYLDSLQLSVQKGSDAPINYDITNASKGVKCFSENSTQMCSFKEDVPIDQESSYTYTITATPPADGGAPHSVKGNFITADLNFTNVTQTPLADKKLRFDWQVIPVSNAVLDKLYVTIIRDGEEAPIEPAKDIRSSCTPAAGEADVYTCSFTTGTLSKGNYTLNLTAQDVPGTQYQATPVIFQIHDLAINEDFKAADAANYSAKLTGSVNYSGDVKTHPLTGSITIKDASGAAVKNGALSFTDPSEGSQDYDYSFNTGKLPADATYTAVISTTANGVTVEDSNVFTVHQLAIETLTATVVNGDQISVLGIVKQPGAATNQTLKTLSMQITNENGAVVQDIASIPFTCNGTSCSYSITSKNLNDEGEKFTLKLKAIDSLDNTAIEKTVNNISIEKLNFSEINIEPQQGGNIIFNWNITPKNGAKMKSSVVKIVCASETKPIYQGTPSCSFDGNVYSCSFNTNEIVNPEPLNKGDYELGIEASTENDKPFAAPITQFGLYTLSLDKFSYTNLPNYAATLSGEIYFSGKATPSGNITLYRNGNKVIGPTVLSQIVPEGDHWKFTHSVPSLAPGAYTAEIELTATGIANRNYKNLAFNLDQLQINNDVTANVVSGDKVQVTGKIMQPGFAHGQKVQSSNIVLHNSTTGTETEFSQYTNCDTEICDYSATSESLPDGDYTVYVGAIDTLGNIITPSKFTSVSISPFTFDLIVPQGACPSTLCYGITLKVNPGGGQPAYNVHSYSCDIGLTKQEDGVSFILDPFDSRKDHNCNFTVTDSAVPEHSVTKSCILSKNIDTVKAVCNP